MENKQELITEEDRLNWLSKLTPRAITFINEYSEAHEILTLLAESLPKSCNCDFEQIDGRYHGTTCEAHRAEEFLNSLGL